MILTTSQMNYRLDNLNTEHKRVAYQISSGRKIDDGSEDSDIYGRELYVENKLSVYREVKVQLNKAVAQNNASDTAIMSMKKLIEKIKANLIKANTSALNDSERQIIGTELKAMRENIFDFVNTKIEGDYVFSGRKAKTQAFVKDANGKVTYQGDIRVRKILSEEGSYRERGITGMDLMMYPTSVATKTSPTLTFTDENRIVDQNNEEWNIIKNRDGEVKFIVRDEYHKGNAVGIKALGTALSGNPASPVFTTEIAGEHVQLSETATEFIDKNGEKWIVEKNASGKPDFLIRENAYKGAQFDRSNLKPVNTISAVGVTPVVYATDVGSQDGTKFEAKRNFFDILDESINALNQVDKDGNPIDTNLAKDLIGKAETNMEQFYTGMNAAHAKLGTRNKVFEFSTESITTKLFQFKVLSQDVIGVDLGKLAVEAKALEVTYAGLYSTINKTSQLSLVNYIK